MRSQMWHAAALLVMHGFAGVLWTPAGQLLLHDIVGPAQLQSAVRLNATSRWLGLLMGPAVGGGILLALGPAHGILVNALIYLPLVALALEGALRAALPKERAGRGCGRKAALRGFADIIATMRSIAGNRTIVSMTLLAGGASVFIGNAYQAQMPEFAHDLGHGDADMSYSMLLAADAAGALIAGLVLESRGLLPPHPRTAFVLAMLWCCAIGGFAAAASLSARPRAPVRRGLSRTLVQRHGADAGAGARARAAARPRDRTVQHVRPRPARLQRRHGRHRGQPDRHPLVARRLGHDAARDHHVPACVYDAWRAQIDRTAGYFVSASGSV